MSLVVGQNSWITIAEADTYLTDRIGALNWFTLSDSGAPGATSKTSLIISSFYWLLGAPQLELSTTLTDPNVKNAQAEACLYLLDHYDELNERRSAISMGVENFKLSKRSEKLNRDYLSIPDYILGMLGEYQINNCLALLKGEYDV